jgi:hypothetical protein
MLAERAMALGHPPTNENCEPKTQNLSLPKNPVRLLQRLLRPDVVPDSRHLPRVNRRARIQPLDQAAWLIGIVLLGYVLMN